MTKFKLFSSAFVTLALLLSSCTSTPGGDSTSNPSGSENPSDSTSGDSGDTSKDSEGTSDSGTVTKDYVETHVENILKNHNYTADISCVSLEDTSKYISKYSMFNISNDVLYTDGDSLEYYGFIRQKDQGIVEFESLKAGSAVIPGAFIATNVSLGMSDLYALALEHIGLLQNEFTRVSDNIYNTKNREIKAIVGNLAFGDYVVYATEPEVLEIKGEENELVLSGTYIYNYQSEDAGSLDDTFIQEPHIVTIRVKNIGSTHNESFENYVKEPTTTYSAPLRWSETDVSFFNTYYNSVVPPFIDGLSYSYRMVRGVSSGEYVSQLEDYASGDLTSAYGAILDKDENFVKKSDTRYVYEVTDEEAKLVHTYAVEMRFTSPETVDRYGIKTGYYFPKGVFTVKFVHTTKTAEEIVTVDLANSYIQSSKAKGLIKKFPLTGSYKVSNFLEGTAKANEAYGSDFYALVVPTRTAYFNIYIPTYDEAVKFIKDYTELQKENGFEPSGSLGTFVFYTLGDEYNSLIRFGDIVNAGKSSYKGYVQVQLAITNDSVDEYNKEPPVVEKTLTKITLSSYTTTYNVNDTFRFDGKVTAYYSDGTSKEVSPTRVTSPDMSKAGTQQVIVYYAENGVEKFDAYTITISGGEIEEKYSISYVAVDGNFDPIEGDIFDFENGEMPVEAKAGDRVKINFKVKEGYEFVMFMPYDEQGAIEEQISDESILSRPQFEFVMPEYDAEFWVMVTPKAVEETYEINTVNDLTNGLAINVTYPTEKKAKAGQNVQFKVVNEQSVEFNLEIKDSKGTAIEYAGPNPMTGVYQFTMPVGEVTITISKKSSTPATLKSISVVDPKTSYTVGDTFVEPTVKGTYSDGTVKEITGATFSGYDMSTAGTYTVTVAYDGVTTSYTITVSECSGEEFDIVGTFTATKMLSGYSNTFSLVFKNDGTGEYRRSYVDGDGKAYNYNCLFTYEVSEGQITFTYAGRDSIRDAADFASYCMFNGNFDTNERGTINEDGTIKVQFLTKLADQWSSRPNELTFTKVVA